MAVTPIPGTGSASYVATDKTLQEVTVTGSAAGAFVASDGKLDDKTVTAAARATYTDLSGKSLQAALVTGTGSYTDYDGTLQSKTVTALDASTSFSMGGTLQDNLVVYSGVVPVVALDPNAASQPITSAYGLRQVVTGFSGPAVAVRDSTNALKTISITSGAFAPLTASPSSITATGDGVTYGVATWYDQKGVNPLTSAARPYLVFPGNFATLISVPAVGVGGTGYTVGDVLTPTLGVPFPGGLMPQVTVATVASGVITAVTVSRAGKMIVSPSTVGAASAVTGGTGTGATFVWVLTPDAGNTYTQRPYIEWPTTGGLNLATATTPLSGGGTANLAVFVAYAKKGYPSAVAPFVRPGVQSTANKSILLGYGTTAAEVLMTSANVKSASQAMSVSADPLKDSLGRSVSVYSFSEWLSVEEAEPATAAGTVTSWFNQRGTVMDGGGDQRMFWTGRIHGLAGFASKRLTVGTAGNLGSQHNGSVTELIVFNNASPISAVEAQGIGMWQNTAVGSQLSVFLPRLFGNGSGQSNIAAQFDVSSSGDGTAGTASLDRSFRPLLATMLGLTEDRIIYGEAGRSCVGGTAMMRRKAVGDADNLVYWWNEDVPGPGSLMTSWQLPTPPAPAAGGTGHVVGNILTLVGGTLAPGGSATQVQVATLTGSAVATVSVLNAGQYSVPPSSPVATTSNGPGTGATLTVAYNGNSLAYFDVVPGLRYKYLFTLHAQGEEDSTGALTDARMIDWGNQTYAKVDYDRTYLGQPNAPVIVQPLAEYQSAVDPQKARVNKMRRLQNSLLGQKPNVYVSGDTGHLARGTAGNYYAHFGPLINYDPSTGGPEDGYQRAAKQWAYSTAWALFQSSGIALAYPDYWRGPEVVSAAVQSAQVIRCTIGYPFGCGGTDFASSSGTLGGFRVFNGGGDLTVTAVTRVDATHVDVTFTGTLGAGGSIVYEPNYATPLTHLRDNNSALNMPVNSSQIFQVS